MEKEIVLTFAEPVADLVVIVNQALTATDNRGYSVSFDAPSNYESMPNIGWYARFPGTGITQVKITNPVQWKWVFGPPEERYWMMSADWVSYTFASTYKKCNCEAPTVQAPPIQNIKQRLAF